MSLSVSYLCAHVWIFSGESCPFGPVMRGLVVTYNFVCLLIFTANLSATVNINASRGAGAAHIHPLVQFVSPTLKAEL